jgi:hypothetical protein
MAEIYIFVKWYICKTRFFVSKPKNLLKTDDLVTILDQSNGCMVVGTQCGLTIRFQL